MSCFNLLSRLTNCVSYKDVNCSSKTEPNSNLRFSLILFLTLRAHKDLCSGHGFLDHTFRDEVILHGCRTGILPDPIHLEWDAKGMRPGMDHGFLPAAWLTSRPLSKVSLANTSSRKLSLGLLPSRSLGWLLLVWTLATPSPFLVVAHFMLNLTDHLLVCFFSRDSILLSDP